MKFKSFLLVILFTITISSCSSLPHTKVEKIGERNVEYAYENKNSAAKNNPTVIFETGLGAKMDWWGKVIPKISADTSYFAYNRAGYGKSTESLSLRDGENINDELRQILKAKKIKPPYILVGHSLGGLYMQLYARRYPQEVSALILVDSTHPKQFEGKGAFENLPLWVRGLFKILLNKTGEEELANVTKTGDEVLHFPAPKNVKIIVLSAKKPLEQHSEIADDANEKRKDVARLYPNSKQIWVDSGHAVPLEKPDAIIEAIYEAKE